MPAYKLKTCKDHHSHGRGGGSGGGTRSTTTIDNLSVPDEEKKNIHLHNRHTLHKKKIETNVQNGGYSRRYIRQISSTELCGLWLVAVVKI